MKYIFTYILILCCVFKLHGDNHIDTIHLNEFIYNESKIIDNQIGVNLQIFNPSLIGQARSNTFSDFLIANFSPVALPWPKMYPARVPNGLKLDPSPPPVMPPAAARDAPSAAVLVSATRNGAYSLIS